MIKVVVAGAAGRMGRAVIGVLPDYQEVSLSGAFEKSGHPMLGKEAAPGIIISDQPRNSLKDADILIDFTTPPSTLANLKVCLSLGKGVVVGTTGFSEAEMKEIKDASDRIPVLISPNMSSGVNLLFRLVSDAARSLPGYQVEIVEVHHDQKADAPSGTAKKLAEVVAQARGQDLAKVAVYGRQGRPGPRRPDEIGIHAVRMGDIVGEHTVVFAAGGERIELTHKAGSRETFARGAVKAAIFLHKKTPGFYSMADLLI